MKSLFSTKIPKVSVCVLGQYRSLVKLPVVITSLDSTLYHCHQQGFSPKYRRIVFLAHLSTKCSVSFCDPSMSGVRCPSVRPSTISLKNISSETAYWILTKLHRNDPWVVPYQSCSNRSSWLHK